MREDLVEIGQRLIVINGYDEGTEKLHVWNDCTRGAAFAGIKSHLAGPVAYLASNNYIGRNTETEGSFGLPFNVQPIIVVC